MGRYMALICTTQRFTFRGVHQLTMGPHRESRHGHQYFLEISSLPEDVSAVRSVIKNELLPLLDGKDLLNIVASPTGEELVEWIHNQIKELGLGGNVLGVGLQETAKNRFVSSKTADHLL